MIPQDDPLGDGVLPLALSPQPPAFSPLYAAVDLPIYVLKVSLPLDWLYPLVECSGRKAVVWWVSMGHTLAQQASDDKYKAIG